ncbi:hypothetical protein C8R45DRAFT_1076100 [Mycena sanguinolenta]|nr:hypothetical protein C8R45DRAFT_1076100 [Mycena sanguinolenta]
MPEVIPSFVSERGALAFHRPQHRPSFITAMTVVSDKVRVGIDGGICRAQLFTLSSSLGRLTRDLRLYSLEAAGAIDIHTTAPARTYFSASHRMSDGRHAGPARLCLLAPQPHVAANRAQKTWTRRRRGFVSGGAFVHSSGLSLLESFRYHDSPAALTRLGDHPLRIVPLHSASPFLRFNGDVAALCWPIRINALPALHHPLPLSLPSLSRPAPTQRRTFPGWRAFDRDTALYDSHYLHRRARVLWIS